MHTQYKRYSQLTAGIPKTLSDLGIDDADMAQIGRMAAVDPSASTNPAPFGTAQYAEIGIQTVHGRL